MIEFEWDEKKAAANAKKHGVEFHEAATVFDDKLAVTFADPDHSHGEFRFITFGLSQSGRLLLVSHTDRGHRVRIISSRLMTRSEGRFMKKTKRGELRSEYRKEDLGHGVRGKHFKAYRRGSNLVLLKPDVAAAFPTEKSVNDALRSLLHIAHQAAG